MSEERDWAIGLSGHLRVVQASFADDESTTRQQYLSEEIARALKTVPPTKRKVYLEALGEQRERVDVAQRPFAGGRRVPKILRTLIAEADFAGLQELQSSAQGEERNSEIFGVERNRERMIGGRIGSVGRRAHTWSGEEQCDECGATCHIRSA